jgi:hypothetical protein
MYKISTSTQLPDEKGRGLGIVDFVLGLVGFHSLILLNYNLIGIVPMEEIDETTLQ